MGTFKTLLSDIGDDLKKVARPPVKKRNSHLIQKVVYHVAPNQVKDATDEDFENIFQRAAFFQTLLKNFLEVTRL